MMKLLALAGFLVFMTLLDVRSNIVQASTRISFPIKPQDLDPSQYVTITGFVIELSYSKSIFHSFAHASLAAKRML